MKGTSPGKSGLKIKTYQKPNYDNIQSSYVQEFDEEAPIYEPKIA